MPQSVFVLSFCSDEETPDQEGVVRNAAPFATLAGAQAEAQRFFDEFSDDSGEAGQPVLWEERRTETPHGGPEWHANCADHWFLVREFPLAD